ncbi:MAG: PspC domain-containing protein [Bacteroidota bacterium]|nr:PspC domain-containing protein [Bacteroidota bacterium]
MENGTKEVKRLHRSMQNRWIAGVCGGVGEYLDVDPLIIRLLLLILVFLGGSGIIIYIVAWIMMPLKPNQTGVVTVKKSSAQVWGIILIFIGALLLLSNMELLPYFHWFEFWDIFSWKAIVSVIIIIIGVMLVLNFFRTPEKPLTQPSTEPVIESQQETPRPASKILRRSIENKKIAGVCGGLAEYLDIDPTIVRLIFVLLTLSSFGLGILLYVVLAIAMPQEKK